MFVNENHFWKDSASTMKIDFETPIWKQFSSNVDFWPKYIRGVTGGGAGGQLLPLDFGRIEGTAGLRRRPGRAPHYYFPPQF